MPVLQFKGKTAVEHHHRLVPHHVIELDPKLSLAKKPSLDGNLIIEGDNLLALKALLPTHAGRVKCIYIDPPYNTGNEGWIYNDNLQQPQFKEWIGKAVGKEGEDACRHDKWCCMMFPRLQLLHDLLRDDGVIFVSIDDNEVHHLRAMMDDIFGEENFVATICWQKRYAVSNDEDKISPLHDFVVVYQRSSAFRRNMLPRTAKQDSAYKNRDNDPRGPYRTENFTCSKTRAQRPNLYYPIVNPNTGEKCLPDERNVWRFSREYAEELAADNRIWWGADGKSSTPSWKNFLSEVQAGRVPSTWWPHEEAGHTDGAKKEVMEILGDVAATLTPKPVDLLDLIIRIGAGPSDIILDSFAGSGTTAHAVLALNAEDKGKRTFILVQQKFDSKRDEDAKLNIAEQVTAARVRRVIEGYKVQRARSRRGQPQDKVPGLGGAFTYARLGDRIFDEFRGFTEKPPAYEDLARYIWFTDTSCPFEAAKVDRETGRIGVHQGTAYYLLYSPDGKGRTALDREVLDALKRDKSAKKVVYCEKVWVHRDELAARGVVAMVVPFNLK